MTNPANAFTPTKEMEDTERFAGRSQQLNDLARALEQEGGHIVIYGNRGVGKSSLAKQLLLMSQNNRAVIDRLTHKPFQRFDYLPIYLQCDDSITTINELLIRLLTADDALREWIPYRVISKVGGAEVGGSLKLKIIELKGKLTDQATSSQEEIEQDLHGLFRNSLLSVVRSGVAKSGVLLIVDEFDRISDRSGLASLLKSLGSDGVKFALVGVATNLSELITEHESVARQLTDGSIHVPPMSKEEIDEIFDRAEAVIEDRVTYPKDTRNWIGEIARGHPYFVQLLGRSTLITALHLGETTVALEKAQIALAEIATKGSAPIQERLYKTSIGHSYVREVILKAFAQENQDEMPTQAVYGRAAAILGLADKAVISVYVGQLVSEKYGAVLEKTRERFYRFKDSLFKAYAAARPYQWTPTVREDGEE